MFGVDAFVLDNYIPTIFIHCIYGYMHACMLILVFWKPLVFVMRIYIMYGCFRCTQNIKCVFCSLKKSMFFFSWHSYQKYCTLFVGWLKNKQNILFFLGCILFWDFLEESIFWRGRRTQKRTKLIKKTENGTQTKKKLLKYWAVDTPAGPTMQEWSCPKAKGKYEIQWPVDFYEACLEAEVQHLLGIQKSAKIQNPIQITRL